MIHPDVEVVDLDPRTWRNIGEIASFAEFAMHRPEVDTVVSILHHNGAVVRVDVPDGYATPVLDVISDPVAVARRVFEAMPGLRRVQIFNKESLVAYSAAVQHLAWQTLSIDEFYFQAWLLLERDPVGLCYYPARAQHWNHFAFPHVRALLAAVPDGATVVLGVYDEHGPWFTLIIRISAGQIRLITTFDTLVKYGVDTSRVPRTPDDMDAVCALVEQQIGPVAYALCCDRATFTSWLTAEHKQQVVAEAVRTGAARMWHGVHDGTGAQQ